jgi:hypothetical protein
MKSPLSLAALVVVVAGLGAGDCASAGSLHWLAPLAECYDTGVSQKRTVVVIFYDSVSNRLDADKMSIRLGMSPRMQALSDTTVWCMGDVTRDLVAKNIAKALGISEYPTLSVLAPNANMLDETGRIVGFRGSFAENHFDGAQDHIIRSVSKVQAGQAKDAMPPAAPSSKR